MHLTGLHLLLTYQCTSECDHCFVWGSPAQSGVMLRADIRRILQQAVDLGTITGIFFEGGEPFLYYSSLLQAVRDVSELGFRTGIVTNGFWAVSEEDAFTALQPFAGLICDLAISCDLFHWDEASFKLAENAARAAARLGIPAGSISIARPENLTAQSSSGQLPEGESKVMFRGRAAAKLAHLVPARPWELFDTCPHEDLREPGRVHLDPLGYVHICQGISVGNIFTSPLSEICRLYDPDSHPVTVALLKGGPAELVRRYHVPHEACYADACHLCYCARAALRSKFPEILTPDAMYGQFQSDKNGSRKGPACSE